MFPSVIIVYCFFWWRPLSCGVTTDGQLSSLPPPALNRVLVVRDVETVVADECSGQVHIQHIVRAVAALCPRASSVARRQDRTRPAGVRGALRVDRHALLRQVTLPDMELGRSL